MRKLFTSAILSLVFVFVLLLIPIAVMASGLQWTLSYPSTDESTEIRIADADKSTVFASIRKHSGGFDLLKSVSKGETWSSTKGNLTAGADANWIAIKHSNKDVVAISLWGSGINLSEDGGNSWTNIFTTPFPRAIGIDPVNTDSIYSGISDSSPGLYTTNNKGLSWTLASPGGQNSVVIIVDSNDGNRVFASVGTTFYRSLDHGASWTSLPLFGGFSSSAIDLFSPNTIFATTDGGFYKSINNGDTWSYKTVTSGSQFIFRVAQDDNGTLYTSVRGSPGSVWRSMDGGETWENVGDPAWGTNNTWGLDAKGGRVIVSVEGLGIYFADTIPPPPPGPNPVVVIPGFGGSWSYKGLVLNQDTTYADWVLLPKLTDAYYQPLLDTLPGAFIFAYDYRKSITDMAFWLNQFLGDKLPDKKANIVAHSMGGLIARQCFEKVAGCADRISKIITAGTPHQGTVTAYDFWEGGKINEDDLMLRSGERLLLHLFGLPKISPKDIVQANFPGVQDLLPIFDYISGRPYAAMSAVGHNLKLEAISPMTSNLKNALTAFSSNAFSTDSGFDTKKLDPKDILFGLWVDGKPAQYTSEIGDNTVLRRSSQSEGANNFDYPVRHKDYFNNTSVLANILSIFGLSGNAAVKPLTVKNFLVAYTDANASLDLLDENGSSVGVKKDDEKSLFANNLSAKTLHLIIKGQKDGDFKAGVILTSLGKEPQEQTFSGKIAKGERKSFNFVIN